MINKELLKEWLDRVYEVPVERDNRCTELTEELPAFVEATIEGNVANGDFSDLLAHLEHCARCSELVEELNRLAALELDGALPEVEALIAELAGEETTAEAA